MKNIVLVFILFICSFRFSIEAQNTDSIQINPFTFEASYIGENVNILSGGIKRGSCYLGMANLRLLFDTEKANLWKGGQFYINAANTHGAEPSANFIGDFQTASNIEAGEHSYIQELWMQQTFGNVDITIGLQDLNVEFLNTNASGLFLNSSFGVIPVLSGNLSVPIFPLTSLGITGKWNINDKVKWLNAIYDGSPTDFADNPYNLNWHYNSGDGILGISELQYAVDFSELPGIYKVGFYAHNHLHENNLPDSLMHNNYGVYGVAEQMLWQNGAKRLSAFVQASISPKRYNENFYYLGAGFNYYGLWQQRKNDVLGFAVAHAGLKSNKENETTLELTYKMSFLSCFFLQPNVQYIINPSGTDVVVSNCWLASIRFGLSF